MNKKLVLEEKDGNVLAGISQKDCDPVFGSFKGSLTDLLMEEHSPGVPVLSGFVAIAETKWAADPKATKYTAPKTVLPTTVTGPASLKKHAKKKEAEAKANAETPKSTHDESSKVIASEAAEPSSGTPQLPLLDDGPGENSAPTKAVVVSDQPGESHLSEVPAAAEVEIKGSIKQVGDAENPPKVETETPADVPFEQRWEENEAAGKAKASGFYLATGEGPFADIQLAMDALGMPKDKRPTHKRYDRLSKDLRAKIIDKKGG